MYASRRLASLICATLASGLVLSAACGGPSDQPPPPSPAAAVRQPSPSPAAQSSTGAAAGAQSSPSPAVAPALSPVPSPVAVATRSPLPLSGEFLVTANQDDHSLTVVPVGAAVVATTIQLDIAPQAVAHNQTLMSRSRLTPPRTGTMWPRRG